MNKNGNRDRERERQNEKSKAGNGRKLPDKPLMFVPNEKSPTGLVVFILNYF